MSGSGPGRLVSGHCSAKSEEAGEQEAGSVVTARSQSFVKVLSFIFINLNELYQQRLL